jgi:membrane-associated protease RseP (regulator of RpoE activity)
MSTLAVMPSEKPQVYRGNDPASDYLRLSEDGYSLLGYSSFNAGPTNETGALDQAALLHAAVVLLYSKYTGTVNGSFPLTLPDTKTSTSTGYGTVGSTSFSGSATTTTYGTKTTYIPYSTPRSDYQATYWIKRKPPILGIIPRELTPELRQEIGSNKGLLIYAVVKGSPAFEADVLDGDVLKSIGGVSTNDYDTFEKALADNQGKEVEVILIRAGVELHKTIKLGVSS